MANYTINTAGSTTCNYPSTVNANDVLTFNITNRSTTTKYQGSMLTYTFPCDCTAEILAAGAKGGNGAGNATGGRGAIVAGTMSFTMGDQLLICVGQAGTNNTTTSGSDGTTGAGGGGTYVVKKVSSSSYRYTGSGTGNNWYVEPLVIAAGGNGGGDNLYTGNSTAVHGSSNQGNENNMSYSSSTYYGGGFSKCSTSTDTSSGRSFLTGATGATESYIRNDYTSYAGFGGGGAARDDGTCGGGGGGYTGGSQSDATAATSFVKTTASNISRKSGDTGGNNGEGYVKITFKTVVPPHEFPEDQVVTTTGFNAKVKTNNSWKDGTKGYVKVNNVWKEINKMYTKVNNQWVLTGEEKKYTVKSLIDEGFVNPNTQLGEYNGTATYSAYTAGTGVQLYVASSSYPTAVGNFKTNTNALKDLKSITFDFTRTSGNTNFNIGIFVSSTAQSGRLNSTNTNNLIKAYKTFNAASGSVTIDLEEAFGSNLNTYINSNYYIGFYLNCSASTTVVIKNATIDIPYSNIIKVLDNGTLNASTALGNYKSTVSYSKYTAGTGITLYKNTSDVYPYSVGTFEGNSDILSKVKSITFDYNRTAGSGNFELGIFYVSSIKNGRLTDDSTLTYYTTKTVTSNTGTVTFDLSELGSTNNNYYLGILFYQTGTVSNTVVIKNVSYIEKDAVSVPSNGPIGTELGLGFYDMNTPFAWTKDANILSSGKILLKDVYNQYGENVKFTLTSTANDLLNMKVLQGKYYATTNGTENGIANAGPIYFFFENDDTDQTITKNLIHTKNTVSFTISLSEFTSKMGGVSYEYFFITLESVFGVSALSNYKLTIEKHEANSGGGSSTPQTIKLIENGVVNTNTIFGSLLKGSNTSLFQENVSISGSRALKMKLSHNSMFNTASFGNLIDASNIESISVTWAPQQTSTTDPFILYVNTSNTAITASELDSTPLGGYTNNYGYINPNSLATDILWTTLEVGMPSTWSGQGYLTLSGTYYGNSAAYIMIKDLVVTTKGGSGSGGNTGGSTTNSLYLVQNGKANYRMADSYGSTLVSVGGAVNLKSSDGAGKYYTFDSNIDFSEYESMTVKFKCTGDFDSDSVYYSFLSTGTLYNNDQSTTNVGFAYDGNVKHGDGYVTVTHNNLSTSTAYKYLCIYVVPITGTSGISIDYLVLNKSGSGESSGGGSGGSNTTTLQFNQGYWDDSEYLTYSTEYITIDRIDVRSISSSSNIIFSITSSQRYSNSTVFVEAWDTNEDYIDKYEVDVNFVANQSTNITITKNSLADQVDASSGSNIAYITLVIYTGSQISTSQFSGTCKIESSNGTMPIDDI